MSAKIPVTPEIRVKDIFTEYSEQATFSVNFQKITQKPTELATKRAIAREFMIADVISDTIYPRFHSHLGRTGV